MMTWTETRARLREDRARITTLLVEREGGAPRLLWLHPMYQCVLLHRLSHLCYRRGHRLSARFFWHLNLVCTGCDISMLSDIGGGFVATHPAAVGMMGKAGRNCTVFGPGGIGGGTPNAADIGGGSGLPVLDDDVTIAPGALVLGPVRVGRGVWIGAGSIVTRNIADGACLAPGWRPATAAPGELARV